VRPLPFLVLAFSLALSTCSAGDVASVRRTPNEIALGNASIELVFTVDGGQCMASRLLNKLGGDGMAIKSDDFSIGLEGSPPLRAAEFKFKEAADQAIPGGKRLTLHFDNAARGIGLDVVYELGDSDFFLRRRIELTTPKPLDLRQVDAWVVATGRRASHQGFGEPVFLDDTFWGLEYPGAHNAYTNGSVRLTQFPGRRVEGRFVSQSAVLGVAEHARVAARFLQYVDSFRVRRQVPLFVNYNTWWTLMPPTEANSLALIALFRQRLFDRYGESFDTFTLDDGWDNKKTLWAIVAERFPRNFAPLLAALRPMNANLGLWLSPSSGYNHAPNLAQQGYEHNSNAWFCCQSGPRYRRDIVQVVTELARAYGLAFFKFDGFCASCEATGHGHLPGNFAREANIDAFIELMEAVRRVRPDIYLDPTCGIWLSPWWLRYADSLWGEVSGDYPDIITPAPIVRDSATTTRDAVFRQRCAEHPGFPPNAIEHLGIIVITPEPWEDDAAAVVGRGCQLLTLYIKPDCFRQGERDWAFLASLLKWTRHNASTLAHTQLIGGDPFKREAYGFAHFDGSHGIISLRNPFIEPQTVKLTLDETLGWKRDPAAVMLVARIVYPRLEVLTPTAMYGSQLEVRLQGYETLLLQLAPWRLGEPAVFGARSQEAPERGARANYTVYGRPGQKVVLWSGGGPRLRSFDFANAGERMAGGPNVWSKERVFPGRAEPCSVDGARLETRETDGAWQLVGQCTATVPAETKAAMHVLFDPRGGAASEVECVAQVGGKPVQVKAVRKPAGGDQTHSPHRWTWFEFPLPPGKSEVAVTLKPTKGGVLRSEVGWWLWAEHPLKKSTLTLEFEKPLPPAPTDPLPLPINMETEREILTIQPAKFFNTASQWPKPGEKVVYLDEIEPDDVTQAWGTLQKKQSVWEKPMTIAGREFDRGLGTHAPGHIVYDLPAGQFKRFRCLVGRDEHAMDAAIAFEVWLDGKKAFDSGPMAKATPAKPVDLDITGVARLELRTIDGGDGITGDHGDWADAQLVR